MKVYVAGRATQAERVSRMIQKIKDAGHEITFDWTGPEGEQRPDIDATDLAVEYDTIPHGIIHERDADHVALIEHKPSGIVRRGVAASRLQARENALRALRKELKAGWRENPELACKLARKEVQGCKEAEVGVLMLGPDMAGAMIETGIILGDGKHVIILNDEHDRDVVFWYLPQCAVASTEDEVIRYLAGLQYGADAR